MTCCSFLVAVTMLASSGPAQEGYFATPMFLRGQPVWVTPVSRRQLRLRLEYGKKPQRAPQTDVATTLA